MYLLLTLIRAAPPELALGNSDLVFLMVEPYLESMRGLWLVYRGKSVFNRGLTIGEKVALAKVSEGNSIGVGDAVKGVEGMLSGTPKEGAGRLRVPKGEDIGVGVRSCNPEVSPCIIKPKLKPPGFWHYS